MVKVTLAAGCGYREHVTLQGKLQKIGRFFGEELSFLDFYILLKAGEQS